MKLAVEHGWLAMRESATFVRFSTGWCGPVRLGQERV